MTARTAAAWNRYAEATNHGEPADVCHIYRAWYIATLTTPTNERKQ